MVGIPMDRVGAGYAGMWLLLYRYSPASGSACWWCCFSWVVWGILFHITQHPTVVSESLHPAAGFVCAIPAAIFLSRGLQSLRLFWYTCVAIISLDSWDGGERVSCGTRSPVRWE